MWCCVVQSTGTSLWGGRVIYPEDAGIRFVWKGGTLSTKLHGMSPQKTVTVLHTTVSTSRLKCHLPSFIDLPGFWLPIQGRRKYFWGTDTHWENSVTPSDPQRSWSKCTKLVDNGSYFFIEGHKKMYTYFNIQNICLNNLLVYIRFNFESVHR
jgi:hypothetical protein